MRTTKTQRLARALENGNNFTPNQIASRFNLAKPYDAVQRLRKMGYSVYTNTKTTDRGETINTYRLGSAPRAAVSDGYWLRGARGLGLV